MKSIVFEGIVPALLAASLLSGCSKEEPKQDAAPAGKTVSAKKAAYDPHEASKRAAKIRAAMAAEEVVEVQMSAEDVALFKEVQAALDAEDRQRLTALFAKVQAAKPHSDTRRAMVRALGWLGMEALDRLLVMTADDDAKTAKDALELISTTIDSCERDSQKAAAIIKAMGVLKDDSTLEEMVNLIASLPRPLALEVIITVAEGGNEPAVAKAHDAYKFMTDEDFKGRAAAVKWLKDNLMEGEDAAALEKKFPAK